MQPSSFSHAVTGVALVAAFVTLSLLGCALGTWTVMHHRLFPFEVYPAPDLHLMSKTNDDYYVRPYYHAVCYFSGCVTFLLMDNFRAREK
ncbi:hypothetical protein MTO96_044456 [Rhipicephalus appendiculatus]